MKLNQLIAIIQSVKTNSNKAKTEIYQLAQKTPLFQGLNRNFYPREEDGFVYPAENQRLTLTASTLFSGFVKACEEFYNLSLTQDFANTQAKADITIDGQTILTDVPVAYLLFLEKQLIDVKTFVQTLPVLPIDKDWIHDPNKGCYITEPKETVKTKKITDFVVAYEATDHHPAQIKEVSKDVVEGVWRSVELSGALPRNQVNEIMERIDKLQKAVVQAREAANSIEVTQKNAAPSIFSYLFGTMM